MRFSNIFFQYNSNLRAAPKKYTRTLRNYIEKFENQRNSARNLCHKFAFGRDGLSSDYAQLLKQTFQRIATGSENILLVCGTQGVAVGGQRFRKAMQINKIYKNTYNKSYVDRLFDAVKKYCVEYKMTRYPRLSLLGAAVFHHNIEDSTCNALDSEMNMIPNEAHASVEKLDKLLLASNWEKSFCLPNLIGWRREMRGSGGLYEYKMYCRFTDVSSHSFYQSQVDLEYRKLWDDRVVKLDIIDKDDETQVEVLRWVTRWPWPMASREYIFVRRSKIDHHKNMIVLIQNIVDHPNHPVEKSSKLVRVEKYTSNWVIRPHTTFNENGCDFIFTYFDDPKGALPPSASKWAAKKGVPAYVESMHQAAKKYQDTHYSTKGFNRDSNKSYKSQRNLLSILPG